MLKLLIKKGIKKLASKAVDYAEETLGPGKGVDKKQLAIEFIVSNIPLPGTIKVIIKKLFFEVIEEAIEYAVKKLHKRQAAQAENNAA